MKKFDEATAITMANTTVNPVKLPKLVTAPAPQGGYRITDPELLRRIRAGEKWTIETVTL